MNFLKKLPGPYRLFVIVLFWPFWIVYFVFGKFLRRPRKQIAIRLFLAFVLVILFLGLITYLNERENDAKNAISVQQQVSTQSASLELTPTKTELRNLQKAQVLVVIDGDTVEVNVDGKNERIRLIGVDTPEVVDPRKPVQCFGKEASTFTKSALSGKTVWLEADKTQGNRDKYGRLLRYVWIDDAKTDFNKKLIANGYAHQYTYNLPYKYREEYLEAERFATQNNLGLWNKTVCPTPSESPTTVLKNTAKGNCTYSCFTPDRDCKDFKTQQEAQAFFECCGFSAEYDPMKLDNAKARGNGKACESLK